MRIIAGSLKGRAVASPRGSRTHPMSERTRGGLFNALGYISRLSVLDAFAGSGALGFEALSRGATRVVFIEKDRAAQQALASNARALGVTGKSKLIKASAGAWLKTAKTGEFDVLLADPPYDDIQPTLLNRLAGRVRLGGTIVCSLPPKTAGLFLNNCQLLISKSYGDATLTFYRKL